MVTANQRICVSLVKLTMKIFSSRLCQILFWYWGCTNEATYNCLKISMIKSIRLPTWCCFAAVLENFRFSDCGYWHSSPREWRFGSWRGRSSPVDITSQAYPHFVRKLLHKAPDWLPYKRQIHGQVPGKGSKMNIFLSLRLVGDSRVIW